MAAASRPTINRPGWIIFDPKNQNTRNLDTWLEKYPPSKVSSEDVDWICVKAKETKNVIVDEIGLRNAWNCLKANTPQITTDQIRDIAVKHNKTSGKWLFYVKTGNEADKIWRSVATNLFAGPLGQVAGSAKINPKPRNRPVHVVCIYNDNFTNETEVYDLEKKIRAAGVECPMSYKPDVYTACGIYDRNEWKIPPTLYRSKYEVSSQKSNIQKVEQKVPRAKKPRKRAFKE